MNPVFVYDTYATTEKGRIMHFDVVIPTQNATLALDCARAWLKDIGEVKASVNAENCCYCHDAPSAPPQMAQTIASQGYAIYKLEGCHR